MSRFCPNELAAPLIRIMNRAACNIGAIILAAGQSSRFAGIKQLARIKGETMIGRACRIALASGCSPVIVVLGAHHTFIRAELSRLPVNLALNSEWRDGLSSSIRTGIHELRNIKPNTSGALLLLADQPRITVPELASLITAFSADDCAITASEYRDGLETVRGVPAIFSCEVFSELLQLRGKTGAKAVISRHQSDTKFVPLPSAAVDIDTQNDFAMLDLGVSPRTG